VFFGGRLPTCRSGRYGPRLRQRRPGFIACFAREPGLAKYPDPRWGERTGACGIVTAGAGERVAVTPFQNAVILIWFRLTRDINGVVCAYHCAACDKKFKLKVKAKSLDGPR
jgi:hypothetical protein